VQAGRGDDLVRLQGVSVSGKGALGSSSGNDLIQLIDSDFRTLAVNTGNGASTSLLLDDVTVAGRTTVLGGKGANTVQLVGSNLAAVLIQTGAGDDTVRLEQLHATGRVQMGTGRGNDLVAVSDSTFNAAVVLGGGYGHDELDAGTLSTPNAKGNTFVVDPMDRSFENTLS
jgi:large repetitive protein